MRTKAYFYAIFLFAGILTVPACRIPQLNTYPSSEAETDLMITDIADMESTDDNQALETDNISDAGNPDGDSFEKDENDGSITDDTQTAENDVADDYLFFEKEEGIKRITKITRYGKDDKFLDTEYEYSDNEDKIVKDIFCTENGEFVETTLYEFDSHGNTVKETITKSGNDTPEIVERKNEYDADGNLIKKAYEDTSGEFILTYDYDDKGLLINDSYYSKFEMYGKEYITRDETTYEYDSDANLIKKTHYTEENGVLVMDSYEINKYDAFGDIIETANYKVKSDKASLESILKNEYNQSGKIVKTSKYDSDNNLTFYTEMKYNENGDIISSKTCDKDGIMQYNTFYEYY